VNREKLAAVVANATGASNVEISDVAPLSGGAVRRHWRVDGDIAGAARSFVLRADGLTKLGVGLNLADEFALLRVLAGNGIAVPRPVVFCADASVIGAPFHLTEFLPGSADPAALVSAPANDALAERLGHELAMLHRLRPSHAALSFLGRAPADGAAASLARHRALLDGIDEPRPIAEWAMRWLAQHAPAPLPPVLCHGDFRTGNYLVKEARLVAILDWEFAEWGDPDFDLAWFCARFWRFGKDRREAGGIATRAALIAGYEAGAGRAVDPARLHYWAVMSALKWLVIALLQRDRFLRGGERNLELGLTGRRAAECEYEMLRLMECDAGPA
jgi:aminoglycoside phosphotransferase (APT) family kinase protein